MKMRKNDLGNKNRYSTSNLMLHTNTHKLYDKCIVNVGNRNCNNNVCVQKIAISSGMHYAVTLYNDLLLLHDASVLILLNFWSNFMVIEFFQTALSLGTCQMTDVQLVITNELKI